MMMWSGFQSPAAEAKGEGKVESGTKTNRAHRNSDFTLLRIKALRKPRAKEAFECSCSIGEGQNKTPLRAVHAKPRSLAIRFAGGDGNGAERLLRVRETNY